MNTISTPKFKSNATEALGNKNLQKALGHVESGFVVKRRKAMAALPEFDRLRDNARDIKNHTLANLDLYLEAFEEKVSEAGGHVHWAANAEEARGHVLDICRKAGAKTVTKGKTMIAEEIFLNDFLEKSDIEPIETDLGEYIIQLRGEMPSHIIAPALHVLKDEVEEEFRRVHDFLPEKRNLEEPESLLAEARQVLRKKFLDADVGITGANFLIAETGTSVIVTNEGNGDLTQILPRVHIVLASLEKVIPTLDDASQILRLLARSATGQDVSVYTTFSTGPKRKGDVDGPEEYHVILLDNGRTDMIGTEFQDMLRCIRCGACMNHCPVYQLIGGHAYGWVYPGPMGAVLTPSLVGVEDGGQLPNASTFCGRCEAVCPMHIPLPKMMRHWRQREFEKHLTPKTQRYGLKAWAYLVKRPRLHHLIMGFVIPFLSLFGRRKGFFRRLPFAGEWTKYRELPTPESRTFQQQWAQREALKQEADK